MAQRSRQPLTAADGAWWRMDHPTNPMTITGVFTFAAPLPFEALRALLEARLLAYGRFRQRVVDAGGATTPAWEDDPDFSLDRHFTRATLPAGDDQHVALQQLVSELMSETLPADRPPWLFTYVEGYHGSGALVARVHHCIGDGISLVQVLLNLADEPPAAPPVAVGARERRGTGVALDDAPPDEPRNALLRAIVGPPARLLSAARIGGGFASVLGRLLDLRADPDTPLRGQLGRSKRAAWSHPIPLAEVKRIAQAAGGTLNDVLLSAVSGALRGYLEQHGRRAAGLTLRAVVPVNLRAADDLASLGNKFGMVFLPLPVGLAHPIERLRATKRHMDRIKRSPEAVVVFGLLQAFGKTTAAALVTAVNLLGRRASAVMTNVPGPRERIRFCGVDVDSMMFWVPQSGRLGLGVSILSYAGEVRIGIASDGGLVPDPERIVAAFHHALDELLAAATHVAPPEPAIVEPAAAGRIQVGEHLPHLPEAQPGAPAGSA